LVKLVKSLGELSHFSVDPILPTMTRQPGRPMRRSF